MVDYAEHIVDSVYLFRFPDEIIEQFSSTPESSDCYTTYKDAKFHIQCPRAKGQRVLSAFLEIYTTYIEASTKPADELDNFELPKVSRRVESGIDDDPSAIYEDVEEEQKPERSKNTTNHSANLINHESEVRVFDSSPSEEFATQTLRAVEKLTNCTIVVEKSKDKITIKGDTAEDVDKAIGKLVVISKSYSERTSGSTSFDFYIPENEVNFRFHFHTPDRVIDRQILLSSPNFMSDYAEIHMVKWNSSSGSWLRVPIRSTIIPPLENTSDHPWSHYVYPAFGGEKDKNLGIGSKESKTHDYLVPAQVNKLTAWTENIPLQPEDPFNAIPVKNAASRAMPPPATTPQADYMKSKRVPKGQIQPTPDPVNDETSIVPQPPPIAEPYMPAEVVTSAEEDTAVITLAEPTTIPTIPKYRERGALIDHPEPLDFLPITATPSQPAAQCINAQTVLTNKEDEFAPGQEVLRKLGLLQLASQPVPEKAQRESEASSRQFRRSTNLQVPKTGSMKIEATPIIDRIINAVSGILEMTQTSYGRVTLEIVIGHIYVGNNEQGANRIVEQSDWSPAFKTRNGADRVPTFFSSVLTTSWTDVKFMVGLKLPSDTRIFSETPAETRITYVIECDNRYTKQAYTIVVDQTGKTAIYNDPESIGSVNCHFPKRVWDASFMVMETTFANLDPRDPIKSVADNLWVKSASLAFLGGRISGPEVAITSIIVRREQAFACVHNPDLLLRLTEVQDLVLVWRPDQKFEAYAETPENMIKDENRIWWEASISSKTADRVLAENQTLELGEVAKWTLDDIMAMYVGHDMFLLAEQVVTRIDSVGQRCNVVLFPPSPSTSRSIAKSSSKTSRDNRYTYGWSDW